jgi:hypothetical protein
MKATVTMIWPVALLALTACASRDSGRTAGTTVTTVPTTQGEKVVVVEPGARVQGEVRHTVTGKVEGIDRNAGQITIKATDGSKSTLKLPPLAAGTIREGDDVSLNVVVRPRP